MEQSRVSEQSVNYDWSLEKFKKTHQSVPESNSLLHNQVLLFIEESKQGVAMAVKDTQVTPESENSVLFAPEAQLQ